MSSVPDPFFVYQILFIESRTHHRPNRTCTSETKNDDKRIFPFAGQGAVTRQKLLPPVPLTTHVSAERCTKAAVGAFLCLAK